MVSNSILHEVTYLEDFQVDEFLAQLILTQKPITLGFLNQHGFNLIAKSPQIKRSFSDLDFILRDGVGIKLACKFNQISYGANLNGTDLIPKLINMALLKHKHVNFIAYGTKEPWLSSGCGALFKSKAFLSVDGFKEESEYISHFKGAVNGQCFNIVVLAMGMPKQENIAKVLKECTTSNTLFICGGAIIDFQANRHERAPDFFRNNGLEWLYRLVKEPQRMFSRYVIGIPVFFANVARKK